MASWPHVDTTLLTDVAREWPAFFDAPLGGACAALLLRTRITPGDSLAGPVAAALGLLRPGDGGATIAVHEVHVVGVEATAPARRLTPWARHPDQWPFTPHAWVRGAEGDRLAACAAIDTESVDGAAAAITRHGRGGSILLDWAGAEHAELLEDLLERGVGRIGPGFRFAQGIEPAYVAAAVDHGLGALRFWTEPWPSYWEMSVDIFAPAVRLVGLAAFGHD